MTKLQAAIDKTYVNTTVKNKRSFIELSDFLDNVTNFSSLVTIEFDDS